MYLLSKLKSLGPLELGGLLGPKGPIGMGVAMGFEGRAMKSIGDLGRGLGAIGHFPAVFHWEGIYLPVSLLLPQHILAVNSCCRRKRL